MNRLYGRMVRSIAIQRQHRMGSLHSGGQTTDGITRTAFWQGRGCMNCSCRLIRGRFWCNHRSANSSHGFMARGVAIQRYRRMGLLDSGVKTVDGIVRTTVWRDEECANGMYGPIRPSADGIASTAFWGDSGHANSSHGLMVGSINIQLYHRMSSSHPGKQTADGIVRTVIWRDRGHANSSYGLI